MTTPDPLVQEYVDLILPILPLAKQAYGSRSTVSPQHDASREYTRLLVEYYEEKGGSLLALAKALNVAYPGLRRRVTTVNLAPSQGRKRPVFSQEVYDKAVAEIQNVKFTGDSQWYHECLYKHYKAGLSLAKIAKQMGLSSANPLYFAVNKIQMQKDAKS